MSDRTYYRVLLRVTDQSGIDFQNPNNPEYDTASEALDALARLPHHPSPHHAWVAVRIDRTGRAWEQRVIADQYQADSWRDVVHG